MTMSSAPVRSHQRIRRAREGRMRLAPLDVPAEAADELHTTRFRRCGRSLIATPWNQTVPRTRGVSPTISARLMTSIGLPEIPRGGEESASGQAEPQPGQLSGSEPGHVDEFAVARRRRTIDDRGFIHGSDVRRPVLVRVSDFVVGATLRRDLPSDENVRGCLYRVFVHSRNA